MKSILQKLALLAIPVALWFAFFAAFEPNNYFGIRQASHSTAPIARLRAFEKVQLKAGESKELILKVKASDLAFVGSDGRWRLEKGDFRISCGSQNIVVTCITDRIWDDPDLL